MSTAATATATATTADQLSTQEKLLFAQAVYKVGAAAWSSVSSLLLAHPVCTAKSKDAFSPAGCEALYVDLMTSIGQNVPAPDAMKPQNKIHLRLAQTYYIARLNELKAEIDTYENRFTVLMGEINAIKSGTLDEAIREEVKAGLVRRYGKKLLDWLPDEGAVKDAVEKGPVQPGEVDEEKQPETSNKPAQVDDVESKPATAKSPVAERASTADKPRSTRQDKPKPTSIDKAEKAQQEEEADDAEDSEETPKKPVSTRGKTESKKAKTTAQAGDDDREQTHKSSARDNTPVPQSPASELSPDAEPETPAQPSSPAPVEASTRASKRKASAQPRGAPASKRGTRGRRGTSPPDPAQSEAATEHDDADDDNETAKQTDEDEDVDMDAEPEPEPEEHLGRGRRSSKRHSKLDSPPSTSRHKDGSPAASRRAGSVASSASTPQPVEDKRRRGRPSRGMRDDVVSKSVREQSAAVESVKEDEDEAESPAEETRPRTRRGRKKTSPVEERRERDKEAAAPARKTRSAKTPNDAGDEDHGEGDSAPSTAGPSATPHAAESRGARSDRGSEKPSMRKGPRRSEPKAAQTILYNLLDTIQSHRHGSVFQNPVKKSEAPDYYDVIKRPMDLKKIRQRIKDGEISTIDEFERDILLLFANAMMYNGEDSQVYEMAKKMLHEAESHVAHYRTMQDDLAK